MMNKKYVGFVVGGACLALSGYLAHEVRAAGAPATNPLSYAGLLEDNGKPVSGERNLSLVVWNAATNGDQVCETVPASPTAITDGHFELVLSEACRDAVADNRDLWVEVSVDGDSLGRQKIRAVPYALEADNALSVGEYDEAKLDELAAAPAVTRYSFGFSPGGNTMNFKDASGTQTTLAGGTVDAGNTTICRDVEDTTHYYYFNLGTADPGSCTLSLKSSHAYMTTGIYSSIFPEIGKGLGSSITTTCNIPDANHVLKTRGYGVVGADWHVICFK